MSQPTVVRAIRAPWTEIEPIRLGRAVSGRGTPECYVTCEIGDAEPIRVDLYWGSEECYAFTEACIWKNALLIGWGNRVYSIDIRSRSVSEIDLGAYFGHLYVSDEFALVATAEHLWKINASGGIEWKSEVLGIDGVVVKQVEHGVIEGEGEWDPPGGWRPFRLRLDSGSKP